jgi:GTP-binding protein Era
MTENTDNNFLGENTPTTDSSPHRCGYVAIVGAPNAGKSTLLNRLVGSKVAIVSPKVQTTRNRILGITMRGNTQMILCDTPGIFNAKEKFEKAMVASAYAGARDADVVLLLIDAMKGLCRNTLGIIENIKTLDRPILIALNKIDKMDKEKLPILCQQVADALPDYRKLFLISAAKGDGIDDVMAYAAALLPEAHWLYPEDQAADLPMRFLAAEITREKLFLRLREELPYSVAVDTETWEERKDGSVAIRQIIYVRSESQKKIVLGSKGEMLKQVGQSSRHNLGRLLERPVHLFLFVKVAENWKDDREFFESIGLEY